MEYLIRFSQSLETFRLAEMRALARSEGIDMEVVWYDADSPFCIVRVAGGDAAARALVRRSVLAQTVHELWGSGATLAELHGDVRRRRVPRGAGADADADAHEDEDEQRKQAAWRAGGHATASFRFEVDSFRGSRAAAGRLAVIDGFGFLPFGGPIRMRAADHEFTVFEQWAPFAVPLGLTAPERVYLGRLVGASARLGGVLAAMDLKRRRYVGTTSMDAELSMVTANVAGAAPGALFYDPFVGTGSLPLAAAHCGAVVWGSDIDGRAVRGAEPEREPEPEPEPDDGTADRRRRRRRRPKGSSSKNNTDDGDGLRANFAQYGLLPRLADVFSADLTNSPIRRVPPRQLAQHGDAAAAAAAAAAPAQQLRLFDGIICDPPYGVREGLRVLGCRNADKRPWTVELGKEMYTDPDFVPPKQPYSFTAMLHDILVFATETLVDGGRLAFWMPTANDEAQEMPVPTHPCLEVVDVCTQTFNKWSRRLIAYRRVPDGRVDQAALADYYSLATQTDRVGLTADELNPFRRGYFSKFAAPSEAAPG